MYFCIQGKGFTALRVASAHGQTEVTHTLLDRGATVDYQDKVHTCLIDYNTFMVTLSVNNTHSRFMTISGISRNNIIPSSFLG